MMDVARPPTSRGGILRFARALLAGTATLTLTALSAAATQQEPIDGDPTDLERAASVAYAEDRLLDAAALYETLESHPRSDSAAAARYALLAAWIYEQAQRPEERDAAMRRSMEADPDLEVDATAYPPSFLQRVEATRTRVLGDRAEEVARSLAEAGEALESGDRAAARAALERVLELRPGDPLARLQMARLATEEERDDAARTLVDALLEEPERLQESELVFALRLDATLLLRADRAAEAVETLRRALAIEPEDRSLWNDLGRAHSRAGSPEEAAEALTQAVRLDPGSVSARYNLGTALLRLERSDEALEHLLEAGRLDPANTAVAERIAVAAERAGRNDLAAQRWRRVAELEGDAAARQQALQRAAALERPRADAPTQAPPSDTAEGPKIEPAAATSTDAGDPDSEAPATPSQPATAPAESSTPAGAQPTVTAEPSGHAAPRLELRATRHDRSQRPALEVVDSNLPALEKGDLILRIDGAGLPSSAQEAVSRVLGATVSNPVRLDLVRGETALSVELPEAPGDPR